MEATGGGWTVTSADADCPPELAEMLILPALIPRTTPESDTLATSVSALRHAIARSLSVFPNESSACADSLTVSPTTTVSEAGESRMRATGGLDSGGPSDPY